MGKDDYFEYLMACGDEESENNDTNNGGSGCPSGCLPWILGIIAFLWILGKLFG
jgi:hypothetical protein